MTPLWIALTVAAVGFLTASHATAYKRGRESGYMEGARRASEGVAP